MGSKNATGLPLGTSESEQHGAKRTLPDGRVEQKLYFANGYTQYKPYVIGNTASASTSPAAVAPATLAVSARKVCVPQGETTTTAGWYWAVIEGNCTCLVDGTTDVANGAYLEILNAGVALVLDHATAPTAGAVAIALEAQATNAATATDVYLMGNFAQVAAY